MTTSAACPQLLSSHYRLLHFPAVRLADVRPRFFPNFRLRCQRDGFPVRGYRQRAPSLEIVNLSQTHARHDGGVQIEIARLRRGLLQVIESLHQIVLPDTQVALEV